MDCRVDLEERTFWPERNDLAVEFARLLAAAQEGGSTLSECRVTASRIDFDDEGSWYREWSAIAATSLKRGDVALANGHVLTARSNWLRAINYYQAAAFVFDPADTNSQLAIASTRECAAKYLRHRSPAGEVVVIPWPGSYPLEGYFLPAPAASPKRAPAIICIGEPGQRKEEYLTRLARYASDRGMSLLAVDLLGAGTGSRFEEVVGRSDLETSIGHITDYLVERDDVDADRIAILADGWSSSFVARGIAFDDRFAAAVCDGGIWDIHERTFLRDRIVPREGHIAPLAIVSRVARNIKCPVLVCTGERGWLKAERVRELYDGLKGEGRDVALKIFTSEETAAAQGHVDNPTLANEFIFDWVASRLGITA
jgi:hypothetical protein